MIWRKLKSDMPKDTKVDKEILKPNLENTRNPVGLPTKGPTRQKSNKLGINIDTKSIKRALLNFVVPLVCIASSIFLIIAFIYPMIKKYPLIKVEFDNKVVLKNTLQTKVSNLRKLIDFKEFVDEGSDLVSKVLVSEADVPKLLDQVHQISTNSGMTINRLSYSYGGGGDKSSDSYNTVIVSLGTETNYGQIILFMESVENASRFIVVPSFRYSLGRSTENTSNLSANFSIDSPYLFVQSNAVTDEAVNLDISSQEFVGFINEMKSLRHYEFLNIDVEAIEETEEEESTDEEDSAEEIPASEEETSPTE